ncbi:hypothetical protein [Blastopirellula marina]|uniref:Leucine Rich repeats (2 copies) n=1 Tax=Blastopirellula marina TaxID=124 RepID=A0A2S8G870_9BACT|nr:hypothetical protein [Blastopirellula marina]PQO40655.1 hypothetical protein C5Y98_05370 [Blastopirellula marina]PTL45615.1 hypothetical protein C5Y97_05370 [Blastopirellula marina]
MDLTNMCSLRRIFLPLLLAIVFFAVLATADHVHAESDSEYVLVSGSRLTKEELQAAKCVYYRRILPPRDEIEDGSWNDDLKQLRDAKSLEVLLIGGDQASDGQLITAEGLKHLSHLSKLRRLEYSGMRNADEKMKVISQFPAIKELIIRGSDLTLEVDPIIRTTVLDRKPRSDR